jgi:hypothetical protein
MKIDPGFINHWKTEILIDRLGADGVVAILRLWGNAQIRRQFQGLELTPRRLAMETKWRGSPQDLFDTLTDPDAPWLDMDADGTFSIHDFGHHQSQVVALWENGKKGGRPKKVSPTPSSKEDLPLTLPLTLTPLGFKTKPNGFESKPNGFPEEEAKRPNPRRYASHDEVTKYAKSQPFPISDDCVDSFFDRMEEIDWCDDKGLPLANWQARFRRYATNWHNNRNSTARK